MNTLLVLAAVVCGQPGPGEAPPGGSPSSAVPAGPVSPAGQRATADLPVSLHMRNTVGSNGLGLCVFTSIQHLALWQSVNSLDGFREWMQKQPGGGDPQKLDAMIRQFCAEKGRPVPQFAQHEGGDVEFLKLALKTQRMVGVTYCGADGVFYGDVIAHMVNLCYLDDQWAAVLDNNNPGKWLWMPTQEFVARWKGVHVDGTPFLITGRYRGRVMRGPVGGGWAVVMLDDPPPPYAGPIAPVPPADGGSPQFMIQQCSGGRCVVPSRNVYPMPEATPYTGWSPHQNGTDWHYVVQGQSVAVWRGGLVFKTDAGGNKTAVECEPPAPLPAGLADTRAAEKVQAARAAADKAEAERKTLTMPVPPPPAAPAPVPAGPQPKKPADVPDMMYPFDDEATGQLPKPPEPPAPAAVALDNGVNFDRLGERGKRYVLNGVEVRRAVMFAAVEQGSLVDDAQRFSVAAAGDQTYLDAVKAIVETLPEGVRKKVSAKYYLPTRWEVQQFGLVPGLTIRAPAKDRVGPQVGRVAAGVSDAHSVRTAIERAVSPPPPGPKPPDGPNDPAPGPTGGGVSEWVIVAAALVAGLLIGRLRR